MIVGELRQLNGVTFIDAEDLKGKDKYDMAEDVFYITCRVRNCLEGYDFRVFKRIGDTVHNTMITESRMEEYGITVYDFIDHAKELINAKTLH